MIWSPPFARYWLLLYGGSSKSTAFKRMVDPVNLLLNLERSRQSLCWLVADLLLKKNGFLATAESCTGGLIAAACTDLAGSSQWFDRGFVTYSNAAKTDMLGVDAALIAQFGAVSAPVAAAMAQGAVKHSAAQVAVAVTGVAGPTGGSAEKPVGTVWIGWCVNGQTTTELHNFDGDRAMVRALTVQQALQGLIERLQPTQ
jgi:nicotinamide-nucleotide amidase